ncbi:MAG: hypothetical protein GY820_11130 [Gammaproteobacteria bacterium]|nr:hypothetical protein [Gammaproteobacteria bacterium]
MLHQPKNMMVSTDISKIDGAQHRRTKDNSGAQQQQQQQQRTHAYISMLHILQGDIDPAEVTMLFEGGCYSSRI